MKIDEYLKNYPESECYRQNLSLQDGMLKFDDESACVWGGPYPGNFASFAIINYSGIPYWNNPKITVPEYNSNYLLQHPNSVVSVPTKEKPVTLYLTGNDDTSYSKFFETKLQAEQELKLLMSKQPLNFFEEFTDENGWVFTN